MPHSIADLEKALRHVTQGRERIERQRAILERLRRNSLATAQAEMLLAEMEKAQRYMTGHAQAIRADIEVNGELQALNDKPLT
jgi:hypothetical protein